LMVFKLSSTSADAFAILLRSQQIVRITERKAADTESHSDTWSNSFLHEI
jgi:hypothetical protein